MSNEIGGYDMENEGRKHVEAIRRRSFFASLALLVPGASAIVEATVYKAQLQRLDDADKRFMEINPEGFDLLYPGRREGMARLDKDLTTNKPMARVRRMLGRK